MKLAVYDQLSLFDELESEWNDLLFRSPSNRIFSTWEWQSTWWNAYQPGQLWVVTCREDDGRLVGLAPWFVAADPEKGRVLTSIGGRDVTDYLDIIADRECIEQVLGCLAYFLGSHRDRYDHIELCNIPERSITYQFLPRFLEQNGFQTTLIHEDVCPIIQLPGDWEAYLAMLDKKQRHEIRRKMRRAEGVGGDIDWYIVQPSHDLDAEVGRFLEMMAASTPEKAKFLSDQNHVKFFRSITAVLHEKAWLQLIFLIVNGRHAAAYLNFDYNGQILVYNSGLYAEEFGQLSPGMVLLAYNIQHAIATGHTIYDFLQGNEVYKYRMGGKDTHVFTLEAHPGSQ